MTDFAGWLEKNKGLWARVYDEVIAPDLENEWQRRNAEHEKELKLKEEQRQILSTHVTNEVIKNAQLKEENERLKKMLEKQGSGVAPPTDQRATDTSEATVSVDEYHHITDKFNELNKQYQQANQKLKYLERKNVAVMQKNKEMKESVRAWQEYCDRHMGKQKVKTEGKVKDDHLKPLTVNEAYEVGPGIPSSPASTAIRTPQSLAAQQRSSPAPMLPLVYTATPAAISRMNATEHISNVGEIDVGLHSSGQTEQVEQDSTSLPDGDPRTGARSSSRHNSATSSRLRGADNVSSSQTTQDEIVEPNLENVHTTIHDDADIPEIVSVRSLKRKRISSIDPKTHPDRGSSDGTPARPFRVKEEQFSSPPPEMAVTQLHRKETMDLDELGPNVVRTPRRRLRRTNSIHDNMTGTLRNQRSNSAPFHESLIKAELFPDDEETGFLLADVAETDAARAVSDPGGSTQVSANVLQPLDPNVVAIKKEGAPHKRIKKAETRQRNAYGFLTESGETPPPMPENEKGPPPKLARAHYNQRVRATKYVETPARNVFVTPRSAPARSNPAHMPTPPTTTERAAYTPSDRLFQRKLPVFESHIATRSEPSTDHRPIWTMGPPSEPSRKAPAPPPKKYAPLRNKPLAELQISDFKTNPKYNQGYTYAFSETVRKRGDKLCLPGCTNPACCGSTFRTLAQVAEPLTNSQEEELLQDYLGDAYDSFGLTQMSQGERAELILQARTRKMAREHGKHRQAYEGRRSPPGFWRVGFPDTQEQEEDREKAAEMERNMVKERYLEAMRRGGKWVFRDE